MCPVAYEADNMQPCVDAPFDRRRGHEDKFSHQRQLLMKDGRMQDDLSVQLTDAWTQSSGHNLIPNKQFSTSEFSLSFSFKVCRLNLDVSDSTAISSQVCARSLFEHAHVKRCRYVQFVSSCFLK